MLDEVFEDVMEEQTKAKIQSDRRQCMCFGGWTAWLLAGQHSLMQSYLYCLLSLVCNEIP